LSKTVACKLLLTTSVVLCKSSTRQLIQVDLKPLPQKTNSSYQHATPKHIHNQGCQNNKKAIGGGGKRTPKGTSIDSGEDINLQLCVDLPMKANILNQVTFKITPHDFAQKASLEM
jgi:hypothetical protein